MFLFSLVTTCRNPGKLLAETVESVLNQSALHGGRAELQYVIIDGGSTDGTLDYLAGLKDPRISWVSEPDHGMYDGLAKGLGQLTGDVHSYLNAGDLYHSKAFDVVAEFIPNRAEWITGMQVILNPSAVVVDARVPFGYRQRWVRAGLYDGLRLPFVQQESTFWAGRLTRTLDMERLRSSKLAGDALMWATFARHADLVAVGSHLGGWRLHENHLSADIDAYRHEMAMACDGRLWPWERLLARLQLPLWWTPLPIKRYLTAGRLHTWTRNGWVTR